MSTDEIFEMKCKWKLNLVFSKEWAKSFQCGCAREDFTLIDCMNLPPKLGKIPKEIFFGSIWANRLADFYQILMRGWWKKIKIIRDEMLGLPSGELLRPPGKRMEWMLTLPWIIPISLPFYKILMWMLILLSSQWGSVCNFFGAEAPSLFYKY